MGQPMVWGMSYIDPDLTYYLSGPMAGYADHNFPAFEAAMTELRDAGLSILSPHKVEHPNLSGKPEEWAEYLRNDLKEMLSFCQGIILLRGWPQSRGARLELSIAQALDWPTYYYNDFTLTNMNKVA